MGCFPVDFQEVKRPLRTKSGKRPIKVEKRPIKEAKRPIKAMVLVGISVGCLMGCFRAPKPCRKTAPLKRPIKRSMSSRPTGSQSNSKIKHATRKSLPLRFIHIAIHATSCTPSCLHTLSHPGDSSDSSFTTTGADTVELQHQ